MSPIYQKLALSSMHIGVYMSHVSYIYMSHVSYISKVSAIVNSYSPFSRKLTFENFVKNMAFPFHILRITYTFHLTYIYKLHIIYHIYISCLYCMYISDHISNINFTLHITVHIIHMFHITYYISYHVLHIHYIFHISYAFHIYITHTFQYINMKI